jgi:hypothetical protein
MKKTADVTGGKPIAILLQSISDLSAINPLVAFYDIQGGKRVVLFFYIVPCGVPHETIFVGTVILYIQTTRPNRNRHVHAHKCLHCAGIEPATSCVVSEYSHHYAKSAVILCFHIVTLTFLLSKQELCDG